MKKIAKGLILILIMAMVMTIATGCAWWDNLVNRTKGQLVGESFEISTYDNFGGKNLTIKGTKVTLGLLENSANFNSESTGFKSEVLEVTINGNEMFGVGDTLICAEVGVDMVTDFTTPTDISITEGGGFVPVDRYINDIKNMIGKSRVIIISSQLGVPIGVYQGEKVYVTIPADIPKTTLINIDGKSLYIHRANYKILDTALLTTN